MLAVIYQDDKTGPPPAIEASEDLRTWTVVPNVSEANPILINLSTPKQFYRLRAE